MAAILYTFVFSSGVVISLGCCSSNDEARLLLVSNLEARLESFGIDQLSRRTERPNYGPVGRNGRIEWPGLSSAEWVMNKPPLPVPGTV